MDWQDDDGRITAQVGAMEVELFSDAPAVLIVRQGGYWVGICAGEVACGSDTESEQAFVERYALGAP